MEYICGNNTLLHCVGFNLQRLESILDNGIVSLNRCYENDISFYSKNYDSKDRDDYVSLTRVKDADINNPENSFSLYNINGINLIIDDTNYITKSEKSDIHRDGEVLVQGYVPQTSIKGIALNIDAYNIPFRFVPIIPTNIIKFGNIHDIVINYLQYLDSINATYDKEYIDECLNGIYLDVNAASSIKEAYNNTDDLNDIYEDFDELIKELNYELALSTENAYSALMNKEGTVINILEYVLNGRYKIYDIPFRAELDIKGVIKSNYRGL